MEQPGDEGHMRAALEAGARGAAIGSLPTGSAVVLDGVVLAAAFNEVPDTGDPTDHAEIVAIRRAAAALGRPELTGASLYSTMESCPMCVGAMMASGISRLVLGGRTLEAERRYGNYTVEQLLAIAERRPRLELVTGVLQSECESIRIEWRRLNPTAFPPNRPW
jgi:tRNA(adenine34) deaminase